MKLKVASASLADGKVIKGFNMHFAATRRVHSSTNFGPLRDYPVDVLFYASFRGLHNILCLSLYQSRWDTPERVG
jgi:hypothetical protein